MGALVQVLPGRAPASSIDDLLDWTFGSRQRLTPEPPTLVVQLPADLGFRIVSAPPIKGQLGEDSFRVLTGCLWIESMLPLPDGRTLFSSGRDLWLINSQPVSTDRPRNPIQVTWTHGRPTGFTVPLLLAIRRGRRETHGPAAPLAQPGALSRSDEGTEPLRVLALLQADSQRKQVWELPLHDAKVGSPLRMKQLPSTQAEYFADYRVPHCKAGDGLCLILQHGSQTLVDLQPRRGNPVYEPLLALGKLQFRDASWSADGERIYLLERCPAQPRHEPAP
jgi:hypothetical protein